MHNADVRIQFLSMIEPPQRCPPSYCTDTCHGTRFTCSPEPPAIRGFNFAASPAKHKFYSFLLCIFLKMFIPEAIKTTAIERQILKNISNDFSIYVATNDVCRTTVLVNHCDCFNYSILFLYKNEESRLFTCFQILKNIR